MVPEGVDVTGTDPSLGWVAGQLISTPSDLARFPAALVGGELPAPAELAQMETTVPAPDFEPGGEWRYGLGLARTTLSCGLEAIRRVDAAVDTALCS